MLGGLVRFVNVGRERPPVDEPGTDRAWAGKLGRRGEGDERIAAPASSASGPAGAA